MIGIIGAMDAEIEGFLDALTDRGDADFGSGKIFTGKINGRSVAVVKCGIGKVNAAIAATALIERFKDIELIINSGVAGGLKKGIKQGDFVVASAAVQHDYDQTFDGLQLGCVAGFESREFSCDKAAIDKLCGVLSKLGYDYSLGLIASGDQFIASKEKSNKIYKEFNAYACDMETASIAQVCQIFSVPFLGVRSISDTADDTAVLDFYSFYKVASQKSITAVCEFLKTV